MTDKKPLTETAVDRKIDEATAKIVAAARKTPSQRIRESAAIAAQSAKKAPWTVYVVGLTLFGFSLYLILDERHTPQEATSHAWMHYALLTASCVLLPGVYDYASPRFKGMLGLYKAWKERS